MGDTIVSETWLKFWREVNDASSHQISPSEPIKKIMVRYEIKEIKTYYDNMDLEATKDYYERMMEYK